MVHKVNNAVTQNLWDKAIYKKASTDREASKALAGLQLGEGNDPHQRTLGHPKFRGKHASRRIE